MRNGPAVTTSVPPTAGDGAASSRRRDLRWGLLSLLAPLVLVAPQLQHLGDRVVGAAQSDADKHLWGMWLVRREVLAGHGVPGPTDLLRFPDGGSVYILDTAVALLSLPLGLLEQPVLSFNLVVLGQLFLLAGSCFLLGRGVSGRPEGGFVTAAAVVTSAELQSGGLASGISEALGVWCLPLLLLAGLATLRSRRLAPAVLAGLLLAFQVALCWSYASLASLVLPGMLLGGLLGLGVGPRRRVDGALLGQGVAFLAAAALPLLPLLAWILGGVDAPAAEYDRGVSILPGPQAVERLAHLESTPVSRLFEGGQDALEVAATSTDLLFHSSFLGAVLLAAALLGGLRCAASRRALVGALGMLAVALGPELSWTTGGTALPNGAYLAAWSYLPFFHETVHTHPRAFVVVVLLLGVAAAGAVARLPDRWRVPAALLLGLLLGGEHVLRSPAPWPLPAHDGRPDPTSAALATAPGDGGLIDLDAGAAEGMHQGHVFLSQVHHGRPVPVGLQGAGRNAYAPSLQGEQTFWFLLEAAAGRRPPPPCGDLYRLGDQGFAWVRLWRERVPDPVARELGTQLARCLPVVAESPAAVVFRLQRQEGGGAP